MLGLAARSPDAASKSADAMRKFNTEGPVKPHKHYCIPPLDRVDLERLLELIGDEKCFVLHGPRQSGKTTTLLALRDLLNGSGTYRCVYANFERAQTAREDVREAMQAILSQLALQERRTLNDAFLSGVWPGCLETAGPHGALEECLCLWAEANPKPLVLLIDEIDALVGDSLVAVLRQLRSGHEMRSEHFPQSIVLCGLRDVRDYRIDSQGSPFNIKAESLRLGDFSRDEAAALLGQHTTETGQAFSAAALDEMWTRTQGQPWLVNALAREVCFESATGRDRSRPIVAEDILEAQERLVLQRATHLHQLTEKLRDPRVRRVVQPLLSGGDEFDFSGQDVEYTRDLGLTAIDAPLRIANPIYAEVIPRELTAAAQTRLTQERAWFVDAANRLDLAKLLEAFQVFFREHSEHWIERLEYKEAGPQLLLQAFLQRIVNGGGRVDREYGLGRRRTDLLISWSQGDTIRKYVIECKIRYKGLDGTVDEGLEQTAGYMERCAAEEGHLVIFDRNENRSWDEKVFSRRMRSDSGKEIHVWGI